MTYRGGTATRTRVDGNGGTCFRRGCGVGCVRATRKPLPMYILVALLLGMLLGLLAAAVLIALLP